MFRKTFIVLICIALLSGFAAAGAASASAADARLPLGTRWAAFDLDEASRAQSGLAARRVAVLFLSPSAGWHAYSDHPGPLGKPTHLVMRAGDAASPLATLYPPGTPEPSPVDPTQTLHVYAGRTPLFVPLPDAPGPVALSGTLDLLLCAADKCLPAKIDLRFVAPDGKLPPARRQAWWPQLVAAAQAGGVTPRPTAPSGPAGGSPAGGSPAGGSPTGSGPAGERPAGERPATPSLAAETDATAWTGLAPRYAAPRLEVGGLAKAAGLGLLAGFILNFMPCVLPVVSIKLSAMAAGVGERDAVLRRRHFRQHNLFFSLGILIYFGVLSVILGATGLAWGQIFQRAGVVLVLTALVFALSLSLFGVFSLPVIDLKFGRMTARPRAQALFAGLLATLLATPCSGPFLGGVLGWALLQPAWIIIAVFLSIGLGMALPYLLLTLFPDLVRRFPRPGPWTVRLERVVGLLLMGTCVYLLSILPAARLSPALALLWLTAVAAWLWGEAGPGASPRQAVLKLCAAALVAGGLVFALREPAPAPRFDAFAATELRRSLGRQTVVVDFTADWCPTCKALEQTTLSPARLDDLGRRYGLRLMRADLTASNPEAEGLLRALGGQSIPVLVIFPRNAPSRPLVLRDLFTPAQLEDALRTTARP